MDAFKYEGGRMGKRTPVQIPVTEIVRTYSNGSMDIEVRGGIQIHLFNGLPHVRNMNENKDWFEKPVYSLK